MDTRDNTCQTENNFLVGFYGISTFVGYLTLNQFLWKQSVLFDTIQFSMGKQFIC